jgi:hypothetical protein
MLTTQAPEDRNICGTGSLSRTPGLSALLLVNNGGRLCVWQDDTLSLPEHEGMRETAAQPHVELGTVVSAMQAPPRLHHLRHRS